MLMVGTHSYQTYFGMLNPNQVFARINFEFLTLQWPTQNNDHFSTHTLDSCPGVLIFLINIHHKILFNCANWIFCSALAINRWQNYGAKTQSGFTDVLKLWRFNNRTAMQPNQFMFCEFVCLYETVKGVYDVWRFHLAAESNNFFFYLGSQNAPFAQIHYFAPYILCLLCMSL